MATTQDKNDEKDSSKKSKAQKVRDLDDLKKEVAMVSDDGVEGNGDMAPAGASMPFSLARVDAGRRQRGRRRWWREA